MQVDSRQQTIIMQCSNEDENNEDSLQFNPISLNSDGEDSEDHSDNITGENGPSIQTKLSRAAHTKVPVHETAVTDCFALAVKSHDRVEDFQEEWHWDGTLGKRSAVPLDQGMEEEALQVWVPQPMFLPTWARTGRKIHGKEADTEAGNS